jgi:hypothetical protein
MGFGRGLACRRGFWGRGFLSGQVPVQNQKDFLEKEKEFLQNQLEAVDQQLENIEED